MCRWSQWDMHVPLNKAQWALPSTILHFSFLADMGSAVSDILLCILAIIIPPLPVFLKRGCGGHLLLNVLLCIFGLWIGGTAQL